jgi:D-tagatose-1,6-bisphosphate aldolase subunit GatZ/KbaZ
VGQESHVKPVEALDEVVRAQKRGERRGLTSVCSGHPYVLRAAMRRAARGASLLIEATCNQVNQHGGYTGMTPAAFACYVHDLARAEGFPAASLILGGDHLGPSVWQGRPAKAAMREAETLIRQYAEAGFIKLHVDASMKLADDDPARPLDVEIASRRGAELVRAAEEAHAAFPGSDPPRYVIGTEVPVPGGSVEDAGRVEVTTVDAVCRTIDAAREAFLRQDLAAAWERVMAVVVQPGVEFGDDFVLDYDPARAGDLSAFIAQDPRLVYEAHSTDYQRPESLTEMVADHFAVLKVGPALTFAFREAVFALAHIENELWGGSQSSERSRIIEVLDQAMLRRPEHWVRHYRGTPDDVARARKYSLSDRSRYYWTDKEVQPALERLIANLAARPIPWTVLSQFLPCAAEQVREGVLEATPQALLMDRVASVLEGYAAACGGS